MAARDERSAVTFRPTNAQRQVDLRAVRAGMERFLADWCDIPFVPPAFRSLFDGESGAERLRELAALAGHEGDVEGFVRAVVRGVEQAAGRAAGRVAVGGIELPYHLLLAVLGELVPGGGSRPVKRVAQLEELTDTTVPADQRDALQRVLDLYPVRLSRHVVRQMRLSPAVARQYYPFVDELDRGGDVHTWVGQFHRGIVEQMYRNRVIFVMNMTCPVYCRFCFRKHKECRNQRTPTQEHVRYAVAYVRDSPDVHEVVLTGGDPFMNRATLRYAVQVLGRVPHVRVLRLASRAVSYFPELFLRDEEAWLRYLVRANLELGERGKRLELATHFVHPDELSPEALEIVSYLARNGVPVYVQTPYVRGCNDSGRELIPLYEALRAAGAELHYLFMPTSPIQGNRAYWASIAEGLAAARHLRAHLSDRALPHVTTATCIGKIDWNTSGWAVERDAADPERLWIRTPYPADYYDPFAPILQLGDRVRTNAEGTFDAAFRCEIGADELFAGRRRPSPATPQGPPEAIPGGLSALQSRLAADPRDLSLHLGERPTPSVARPHPTRLEIDAGAPDDERRAALAWLRDRPRITDVVVAAREDPVARLAHTLRVLDAVLAVPHVRVVRLRSLWLLHHAERFATPVIERLAGRNRLRVVRPHRLEIELIVLAATELTEATARVVRALRRRGITVYADTPLLGRVNDDPASILAISHACRAIGIEYNAVHVAGTPLQAGWNAEHPIDLDAVVDIATLVRQRGSGREIPRYVVRTRLGEVDYAVTPRIFAPGEDGRVHVTLRPHDRAYYEALDPAFDWPPDVTVDGDGHPQVPLDGVRLRPDGFLAAGRA